MKYAIALILSFGIGSACRYFEVAAPAPPMLQGALLVLAVTLGYAATDRMMNTAKAPQPNSAEVTPPPRDNAGN